jgi:hypothetical protein
LFDWTSHQLTTSQAMVRTIGARTDVVQLPGISQTIDRFVSALP